ncbi:hypothetical protein POV26_02595 [Aequorivita todarodis]|uniref:hypothetical protein n=1 Tax=Aequorivita todarodis TaxID=2036821 RepID=UPI00234FFBF1|nr:hypothetical protein [Aequorivita todarodis]MDC7999914.1 hypothetical protein [Aequorivita todarodis]
MKLLKYLGLLALIISYAFLLLSLAFEISETTIFNLFNIGWAVGILSLILNAIYAIKIHVSEWIFSIFGTCGLVWFALPFVGENFGFASLTIFFIIGIYIHLEPYKATE